MANASYCTEASSAHFCPGCWSSEQDSYNSQYETTQTSKATPVYHGKSTFHKEALKAEASSGTLVLDRMCKLFEVAYTVAKTENSFSFFPIPTTPHKINIKWPPSPHQKILFGLSALAS